jgi:hypothetical protein
LIFAKRPESSISDIFRTRTNSSISTIDTEIIEEWEMGQPMQQLLTATGKILRVG